MNKITFDEKNIVYEYNHGMESTVYLYDINGKSVLLKYFKDKIILDDTFYGNKKEDNIRYIPEETFINKEKKLELISEMDCFKDEVKILDLVYNKEGKFVGYTMGIEKMNTVEDVYSRKQKIKVLELLKEKIELLNENNVYIGDISSRNMLYDGNTLKLCDLDNYRIGEYDIDLKTLLTKDYEKMRKDPKNLDNYMFNLYHYGLVYRYHSSVVLRTLRQNGLPFRLRTQENEKLLKDILSDKKTYQKRYFLDNMRF